eukprot:447318-Ditylum_brightwellii.AAC.1
MYFLSGLDYGSTHFKEIEEIADPLGNHVGLPCSMSMGDTSKVVLEGYGGGLSVGLIVRPCANLE